VKVGDEARSIWILGVVGVGCYFRRLLVGLALGSRSTWVPIVIHVTLPSGHSQVSSKSKGGLNRVQEPHVVLLRGEMLGLFVTGSRIAWLLKVDIPVQIKAP